MVSEVDSGRTVNVGMFARAHTHIRACTYVLITRGDRESERERVRERVCVCARERECVCVCE